MARRKLRRRRWCVDCAVLRASAVVAPRDDEQRAEPARRRRDGPDSRLRIGGSLARLDGASSPRRTSCRTRRRARSSACAARGTLAARVREPRPARRATRGAPARADAVARQVLARHLLGLFARRLRDVRPSRASPPWPRRGTASRAGRSRRRRSCRARARSRGPSAREHAALLLGRDRSTSERCALGERFELRGSGASPLSVRTLAQRSAIVAEERPRRQNEQRRADARHDADDHRGHDVTREARTRPRAPSERSASSPLSAGVGAGRLGTSASGFATSAIEVPEARRRGARRTHRAPPPTRARAQTRPARSASPRLPPAPDQRASPNAPRPIASTGTAQIARKIPDSAARRALSGPYSAAYSAMIWSRVSPACSFSRIASRASSAVSQVHVDRSRARSPAHAAKRAEDGPLASFSMWTVPCSCRA